jgi:hypothetical protein
MSRQRRNVADVTRNQPGSHQIGDDARIISIIQCYEVSREGSCLHFFGAAVAAGLAS